MNHLHLPRPGPRGQLVAIVGKILLIITLVALVVASVVQQHAQADIRAAQHASNAAHNDGACAMRTLTHTLILRTQAAIDRPSTRPEDKPGFEAAINAYQHLHDAQITVPSTLDCRVVLTNP